uniref:Uncharacterized protein n=1 Tax=Oryza brachyantha TaxID=4533 RepID=J3MM92_ORYBR
RRSRPSPPSASSPAPSSEDPSVRASGDGTPRALLRALAVSRGDRRRRRRRGSQFGRT